MNQTETVNLSNCDREPIHIPGSIQPQGVLLLLKKPELEIIQVSQNTTDLLGISPEDLLNRNLSEFIPREQIADLHDCLEEDLENINPLKLSIHSPAGTYTLNGIIHQLEEMTILELEPAIAQPDYNFFEFYKMTKSTLSKMQKASTLSALCAIIVREVRRITGFDRVMVYQFDDTGSGTIIAEAKRENLNSFLGLHYPDSDIPQQAKRLYKLNLLRLIPNINYQPVELVPADNPLTNQPLDLSFSVLRSVSPIHIEYLKNMGVSASMSISLIKDRKLWGLIACHHYSPKFIPYEVRTACEFFGQVMALEIGTKQDHEYLDYKLRLNQIKSDFINSLSQQENWVNGLVNQPDNLLALVSAQGVAICESGQITLIGNTPELTEVQALIDWLGEQMNNDIFSTDSLPRIYAKAHTFKAVASGLLALAITRTQKNYILWFREEVLQSVNWAGDPHKPVKVEADGSLTISPRKSFELWKETVRGKSLPWQQYEIDGVMELRNAIVKIVLYRAAQLAELNIDLERSNSELDAFVYIASHDLKEPLRGIHNYSTFLLEDYADILNEEGVSKLETLVRLTQRMEDLINSLLHFSRLGRNELLMQETNLNQLVDNVIEVLRMSNKDMPFEIRIPRTLPIIHCDRILVEEVFTNLISNALKYNNQVKKWVEIGWLEQFENGQPDQIHAPDNSSPPPLVFYVRDNGIGIREKHLDTIFRIFKRLHSPNKYGGGTGAGLTIVKKIVERHGGRIWVESTYDQGSTFYFTLSS